MAGVPNEAQPNYQLQQMQRNFWQIPSRDEVKGRPNMSGRFLVLYTYASELKVPPFGQCWKISVPSEK